MTALLIIAVWFGVGLFVALVVGRVIRAREEQVPW